MRRVIDGDTAQLADGRLVRYLGIDAPEKRRKVSGLWVEDPEPFAAEATTVNKRMVEGRRVRFEYDIEKRDRFGRLLAYVYLDERMINAALVDAGLAQTLTIAPNRKHAKLLRGLCEEARRARKGLWGVQNPRVHGRSPECR